MYLYYICFLPIAEIKKKYKGNRLGSNIGIACSLIHFIGEWH